MTSSHETGASSVPAENACDVASDAPARRGKRARPATSRRVLGLRERVGVGPNAWWRLAVANREPLPEVLESPAGVRLERAVLVAEAHAAIVDGDVARLEAALDALPDLEGA